VHIGLPALLGIGVKTAQRRGTGVLIQEVLRGGPAEQAGLLNGDMLITVDGTQLDSATALTYALDRHYPGDVVDLTWVDRSGQQRTGKATLASGTS
jgi:S1-C subfamily serine protease